MEFNAGPIDDSVLYRQETHISSVISKNNLDRTLRVRRSDNIISKLCEDKILHHRVLTRLNDMGLYGIIRCGFFKYDNHLITALVERWRRETHTFHLRVGEATITLQDVELVWNLNINGFAVTGVDESFKPHVWQSQCAEWLGFMPHVNQFRGNKLVMSVLDQYCRSILINDNSTHVEVERYTRCVALMIIGGCMLPDSDCCSVNLMYLRLLRDTNQVSKYSWGSAVLAFLYRELCTASTIGKGEIAGPIFILQVWALSRITFLCPDPFGDIPDDDDHNDQILPFPPFGERYIYKSLGKCIFVMLIANLFPI
ncbi:serine/threonine-protein phosphatase 7 long form homolog [Primulina tabacum]|uniref:serine/threonine-protein phosphatase 7 long form homolog n=1 Tax=Primulina tabacum TaxID=48773 RepID=UPI003F59E345